jgi:hypothetical protein
MKESNMPKADFVTSILLMAFGLFVVVASARMPTFASRGANPYSAPGLVSGLIGFAILALSTVLFVRSLVKGGFRLGITGARLVGFAREETTYRILITIGVSVIYALVLLRSLGFLASTAIYVFAFVMLFEYDIRKSLAAQWLRVLLAVVMAAATSGAVYTVFTYLFLVDLP